MKVEQITVFLENQSGRLADVATLLAQMGINLRACTLADSADFGLLRLIVSDPDQAHQALKEHGFTVSKTEVVAVAVPDKPGGLAETLGKIKQHGLNVEYMYAFHQHAAGHATILFRFGDTEKAVACLRSEGVRLLSPSEVASL